MAEEELLPVAIDLRRFLEGRWEEWRLEKGQKLSAREAPSTSMCRFSACFIQMALERITGEEWLVVGGEPCDGDPGGIKGADGRMHGHYWVVDGYWSLIVDVTADQFGWPPVSVVDSDNPHYVESYGEHEVREHLRWVQERADEWLALATEEIPALHHAGNDAEPGKGSIE